MLIRKLDTILSSPLLNSTAHISHSNGYLRTFIKERLPGLKVEHSFQRYKSPVKRANDNEAYGFNAYSFKNFFIKSCSIINQPSKDDKTWIRIKNTRTYCTFKNSTSSNGGNNWVVGDSASLVPIHSGWTIANQLKYKRVHFFSSVYIYSPKSNTLETLSNVKYGLSFRKNHTNIRRTELIYKFKECIMHNVSAKYSNYSSNTPVSSVAK